MVISSTNICDIPYFHHYAMLRFLNFPYTKPIIDPITNQISPLIKKITILGKKSLILSNTGAVATINGIEYFKQLNPSNPGVWTEQFISSKYEIAPITIYAIPRVIPNLNQYFLFIVLN